MPIFRTFSQSAAALKRTRILAVAGLLAALQIAVDTQALYLFGGTLSIKFGFLLVATSGMLFGPVPAGLQAALADVLTALLFPKGAYFPGYTLTALLSGFVYGCWFYGHTVTWKRALPAKAAINLCLNIGLNTLWISATQGHAVLAILPARAVKNLVLLPIETALIVAVAAALRRVPAEFTRGQ
ncbi:MAG: folate family ECF transporter S component [Oscillospiraceae bacterium]|jgi:ECF transporter S component (folate family)|nr:folate family ECF transporter S component [Oscillospiraceae bacterium]